MAIHGDVCDREGLTRLYRDGSDETHDLVIVGRERFAEVMQARCPSHSGEQPIKG